MKLEIGSESSGDVMKLVTSVHVLECIGSFSAGVGKEGDSRLESGIIFSQVATICSVFVRPITEIWKLHKNDTDNLHYETHFWLSTKKIDFLMQNLLALLWPWPFKRAFTEWLDWPASKAQGLWGLPDTGRNRIAPDDRDGSCTGCGICGCMNAMWRVSVWNYPCRGNAQHAATSEGSRLY